jgi:hypothetical protein
VVCGGSSLPGATISFWFLASLIMRTLLRKTDGMLNRVERACADRLSPEQQVKIARARYDAERMREFAERRRQDREIRAFNKKPNS